jgi:dynein heavy chain
MCTFLHQSVENQSKRFLESLGRYNYVTPTSYLELLNIMGRGIPAGRDKVRRCSECSVRLCFCLFV